MTTKSCIDHGRPSNRGGYASSNTRPRLLHRKIFLETHGYLPPVVMHSCDNPRCINPAHLEPGDWDKNNKDRAARGRSAKSVPSRRKITQAQAETIRSRWSLRKIPRDKINGVSAIARDFSVDCNVIYQIVEGRTHVAI